MIEPNELVAHLQDYLESWGIRLTGTSEPGTYLLRYERGAQEALAHFPERRLATYAKLDGGDGMSLLAVHVFEAFTVDSPSPLREIYLSASRSVPRVCEVRDSPPQP
jgi:hypothetical protein